jgi:hypothetical protein
MAFLFLYISFSMFAKKLQEFYKSGKINFTKPEYHLTCKQKKRGKDK